MKTSPTEAPPLPLAVRSRLLVRTTSPPKPSAAATTEVAASHLSACGGTPVQVQRSSGKVLASAWNAVVSFTCLRASRCCFQGFLEEHLCECSLGSKDVLMSPNGPRMHQGPGGRPGWRRWTFPSGDACTQTSPLLPSSVSAVRPALPTFRSQDPLAEDAPPSQHTLSETHTHSSHTTPAAPSRQADWLLWEYPYSEGVAEHKQRGTCWDCLRFHGDGSDDLPVSGSVAPPTVGVAAGSCLGLVNLSICCVFNALDLQFGLVAPPQGLTWADDLSSHDLTSLRFICHIELSTFLQTLGVQTKGTRSRRLRTRGAFHVPPQCWKS